MCILENIQGHQDLIKLNKSQRLQLCSEIRDFIISNVSKTGGHVSSNMGVVELTVALETVFDTSVDRLVFDVGHQSYIHKLLTGRQADFSTLARCASLAAFPAFPSLRKVIQTRLWQAMLPVLFRLHWVWPEPEHFRIRITM